MRRKLVWIYSRKARIVIVAVFVLLMFLLCMLFRYFFQPDPWSQLASTTEIELCHLSTAEAGTLILWLAISIILSTACALFLKGSTDSYFIREELVAVSLVNSVFGGLSFTFYFRLSNPSCKINLIPYLVLSAYLVSFYVSFIRSLKTSRVNRIYAAPAPKSSNHVPILTMKECLQQPNAFEQLKVVAEKFLFIESILFLKSIYEYWKDFEKSENTQRYDQFRKIVLDYILSDSPFEVNLSSSSKNAILQVNNETIFSGLDNEKQREIFDEAFAEIEQLVWANFVSLKQKRPLHAHPDSIFVVQNL